MSHTSRRRKLPLLILLLLVVMTLSLVMVSPAGAEGAPYKRVPGYPKFGCYDVAVGGIGMWNGNSTYWLSVNVPGPVVDAQLVWIGTEDVGAPDSPNKSDLTVGGTQVVGNLVDSKTLDGNSNPWYMWRANIGPDGYNLIKQGANEFPISGWAYAPITSDTRRNGISAVVVYDTGACTRPNQVELIDSMDWYWERTPNEGTTAPMTFTFPPAPVDREAAVWLSKAGTDSLSRVEPCRPENIWSASGTGTPPDSIVFWYANPPVGINGGKLVVKNGFTQPGCPLAWYLPVTELLGWQDGYGYAPGRTGFISTEWSILRLKIKVPAGATWLAVQGESVKTGANDVEATGESGAWFGQLSIPLYNPELKIAKTDDVTLAKPGDKLTYTISYENYGYGDAENTTIVDKLPDHCTFVSASDAGAYDPGTRTVKWNLGTVGIGQKGKVGFVCQLDPVFEAGTTTLTNEATISTTTPGEIDLSDNKATDTTDVFARVELAIDKTAAPEPVDAGANLTYTVDWTVGGDAYAYGVKIVDTLPNLVSFVDASDGGLYDPVNHTVTWDLGDVTPVVNGSYTVVVKVDTPLYNGIKLTNKAVISDDAGDTAQASVVSTVRSSHELKIEKLAAPEPVDAGSDLTYTINWAVTGNEPAKNAMIVDTLPDKVVFKSATGDYTYDAATRKITWKLGELMTPKSGSFTVVVTVVAPQYNGTRLTNVVDFTDETPGSTPAQSTVTSTVRSSHELKIEKLAAPEPVEAGGDLTYTINWAVTGNEPARNAKVVDTLPAGVIFKSATGDYTYDAATRKITWSLGEVMTPKDGSFTVVVTVPAPQYDGTELTNAVAFTDETPGSTPVQTTVTSTIHADHTLAINKVDDPDPVKRGEELTYTINWSIAGNEFADDVMIVDAVPFGTLFVSASDGGTHNPATNTVTWMLGDKVPGDAGSVKLVVKVNKDFPKNLDIINLVTISDYKPGKERTADAVTKLVPPLEGMISGKVWLDSDRSGVQEPGEPGIGGVGLVLYNAGADGQCGTADDAPVANTVSGLDGKYAFTELAAGTYCVKVLDATVPAGLKLVSGTDPHGPIVLAEGGTYPDADFGYDSDKAAIGNRVWSDPNGDGVQDPGEVGLEGVTLDLLNPGPDGLCDTADDTKLGSTTTGADGIYWFLGLEPGKYCVKVTGGVPAGAMLTGGTNPHGPVDLAAGETYPDADFGYRTTCLGRIGDLIFYDANRSGVYDPGEHGMDGMTVTLLAPGPDGVFGTADDKVVAETVTDADGKYLFSGLSDGTYRVVPGGRPGYTQTYGVPDTDNNGQVSPYEVTLSGCGSVLYADFGYADDHLLKVTKVNDVPAGKPVEAGADMVYTISYCASGREPAPNAMLKDPLPLQLDFIEASNGGTYDPATRLVTWSLGNLNPGDCGTVTLKVHVKKPLPNNSFIFNTVTIIDDAKVTDQATDIVKVHAVPILSLTKTADPSGEVKPGDTIKYTLCWSNTGNGNATDVVLTDMIPARTMYVEGSASPAGVYDPAARTLTWDLGTVGPDVNACGSFQVKIDLTLPGVTETPQGWTVDNVAHLSSAQLPQLEAKTSNPLNAYVKPVLTKEASPAGTVKPGDTITYKLCFANQGTANVTGAVLTDVIPLNTTYVPGSAAGATYNEATRTLTWNLGVLAPGSSACGTFKVTVNLTIVGLTGQANVAMSFSEWNNLTIDNTATLKTDQAPDKVARTSNPLDATVKPQIYKAASASAVHMGDTIVFTVTLSNGGTANATDVVITDMISPKLEAVTLTSSKGTTSYDPVTRVWTVTVGVLAPNNSETVTVVITGKAVRLDKLTDPICPLYTITNMATVAFKEGAPRNSNEAKVDVCYFIPPEIPEPGTWLLLGSGLAGLAGYAGMRVRTRRRKND